MCRRDAHGRTSRASGENDLKNVPKVGRKLERLDPGFAQTTSGS
jgi:hypothetical protein